MWGQPRWLLWRLGTLQIAVLHAVAQAGTDSHGRQVCMLVSAMWGAPIGMAQVYRALRRLETRGLIKVRTRRRTIGKRPAAFYHITRRGRRALDELERAGRL